MAITKEILDELLKDYQKPEDLLGQSGLLQQLSKALIERVLDGEMTHHLGYEKHSPEGKNSGNSRKGKQGEIPIEVPPSAAEFARLRLVEGTQGGGGRA